MGASETSLFERASARYAAVWQGVSFPYYTKDDRVRALTEFFDAVEEQYALLSIKRRRVGLDFQALKQRTLAAEAAIGDVTDPVAQAEANLRYLDRVRQCAAQFQDGHLLVEPASSTVPVVLPFRVEKIEGKFVVTGLAPKLLAYEDSLNSDGPQISELAVGDEVLTMGGVPPAALVQQLASYIRGSSAAIREIHAADALTTRDFAYPDARSIAVEIRKRESGARVRLQLQWLYAGSVRSDLAVYLQNKRFMRYDQLKLTWDADKSAWNSSEEGMMPSDWQQTGPSLLQGLTYVSEADGDEVVRTGYLLREGKAIGYLRFNRFTSLPIKASGGSRTTALATIQNFVKELKRAKVPLILDLRFNYGGSADLVSPVASALSRTGHVSAGSVQAFRLTRENLLIKDAFFAEMGTTGVLTGVQQDEFLGAFAQAVADRAEFTAAMALADVAADPQVGGYDENLVVLTSARCSSGCDMLAGLLKGMGRGPLLGTPTQGTGAGYLSSNELPQIWRDSRSIFKARIPCFLFGRPGGAPGIHLYPGKAETLTTENEPVTPHETFEPTLENLVNAEDGWVEPALKLLVAPEKTATKATSQNQKKVHSIIGRQS